MLGMCVHGLIFTIKQLILAPIGVIVYSSDNATPSIPSKVT